MTKVGQNAAAGYDPVVFAVRRYAMTGPGSGATSSWWHEPLVSDAASFAAIVDIRNVSFSQQQQMMEAAIRYEEAYAKSVGPREPVVHKRLTSVINFDTTKLDKSDGVNRSLGYYQKLVGEGKVEHVAGRTDLEMKAIADQHSGEKGGLSGDHASKGNSNGNTSSMSGAIGDGPRTSHTCKKCAVIFDVKATTKTPRHQPNSRYCGTCVGGGGCKGCA